MIVVFLCLKTKNPIIPAEKIAAIEAAKVAYSIWELTGLGLVLPELMGGIVLGGVTALPVGVGEEPIGAIPFPYSVCVCCCP